jgi:hypothetical protein
VLQLASLLWRLRRATSIETGLLQLHHEVPPDPKEPPEACAAEACQVITMFKTGASNLSNHESNEDNWKEESFLTAPDGRELVLRFMRLGEFDNGAFERLGRYQAALWRQVRQTIFTLEALRWRAASARSWRTQDRWLRAARSPSDPL